MSTGEKRLAIVKFRDTSQFFEKDINGKNDEILTKNSFSSAYSLLHCPEIHSPLAANFFQDWFTMVSEISSSFLISNVL